MKNTFNFIIYFLKPLKSDAIIAEPEAEESLGPLEPPYPSPAFKRNYTTLLIQNHEIWNDWMDPFNLYPQLPFDTVLPSDAKFLGKIIILEIILRELYVIFILLFLFFYRFRSWLSTYW